MNTSLFWLTLTALATAFMWVPYILNAMMVRGVMGAMGNPGPDDKPLASWAARAKAAHTNAAENIGVFAALVLAARWVAPDAAVVASAAMIYFYTRIAHYFIYMFGIPVARTFSFVIGFACQIVIGLQILNHISG